MLHAPRQVPGRGVHVRVAAPGDDDAVGGLAETLERPDEPREVLVRAVAADCEQKRRVRQPVLLQNAGVGLDGVNVLGPLADDPEALRSDAAVVEELALRKPRDRHEPPGARAQPPEQHPVPAPERGRVRLGDGEGGGVVERHELPGVHDRTGVAEAQERPAAGQQGQLELLPQVSGKAPDRLRAELGSDLVLLDALRGQKADVRVEDLQAAGKFDSVALHACHVLRQKAGVHEQRRNRDRSGPRGGRFPGRLRHAGFPDHDGSACRPGLVGSVVGTSRVDAEIDAGVGAGINPHSR